MAANAEVLSQAPQPESHWTALKKSNRLDVVDVYGIPLVVPQGADLNDFFNGLTCILDIAHSISLACIHELRDSDSENALHAQGVLLDIAKTATHVAHASARELGVAP